MSDKNCPDCMIDEDAVGPGKRCAQHEIEFLTRELAEAKAKYDELHDERHKYTRAFDKACAELTAARKVVETARKMVISYDAADESFIFSDHGEHHAEIRECPGCRFDVVSENAREAVSEYDAVVAVAGEKK